MIFFGDRCFNGRLHEVLSKSLDENCATLGMRTILASQMLLMYAFVCMWANDSVCPSTLQGHMRS